MYDVCNVQKSSNIMGEKDDKKVSLIRPVRF